MSDHRAGTGTGTALKTLKDILPADLPDLFKEFSINGSITDVKTHKLLPAFLAGLLPAVTQVVVIHPASHFYSEYFHNPYNNMSA
jgi:hypothetical protein